MIDCIAGFNGQRRDLVSGQYHLGNGYRAYSPVLRRFTAPDSWSPFAAGGINPYAYCAGDPVDWADSSGHFSLGRGIGMAMGFVAGIALSIVTEGAAMPAVLALLATVAGDAAIGAGTELATEAIDGHRINGSQVGIAVELSVVTSLAGFALGRFSKLKGISNRPLGGLMMEGSDLGKGLSTTVERSRQVLKFIRDPRNFKHELDMGTGEITSLRINSETGSVFRNRYERDTWTFLENRRSLEEPYYMNDVVRYQYDAVSTINGFQGRMPGLLVRNNVTNMITRDRTLGKSGAELSLTFFNETPNGKSTQRILNDFGLRANLVERRVEPETDSNEYQVVNFYIHCKKI